MKELNQHIINDIIRGIKENKTFRFTSFKYDAEIVEAVYRLKLMGVFVDYTSTKTPGLQFGYTIIRKNYITREDITVKRLTCLHLKVKHMWETGGLAAIPTTSKSTRTLHLLMNDESRKEFTDNGDGKAIEEAEIFLKTVEE